MAISLLGVALLTNYYACLSQPVLYLFRGDLSGLQIESPKDGKMCSYLLAICGGDSQRNSPSMQDAIPQTLLVDVYLKRGYADEGRLQPFIKELRTIREGVIEAEIYKDDLTSVRNLPFVSYIDLPRSPQSTRYSTVSEAANCTDDLIGICSLRGQNLSGSGVVIAILDSEFYRDNLIAKELPRHMTLISNSSYISSQRHGSACAELISDIAPNVTVYLIDTGETEYDLLAAIECLLKLDKKPDIVSSSQDLHVGMFNGKDAVCGAIKNVTSKGIIWINAAGNFADNHWSGTFQDPDEDGFNNFGSNDQTINLTAERGELIQIWLSWDEDWLHAARDYDLYLYAPDGSYAVSKNPQEGYFGQKPMEFVSLVAPSDGIYQIAIKRYNAVSDNTSFQLFSSHKLDEYDVPNSSLGVIACCEDVITVGAVDISTLKVENMSSRGPTGDGRLKPDIVAPDNVTTITYWPEKFKGTSAAAPHVVGCVALAIEKFGRMDGQRIKDALERSAKDLGAAGPDNVYGYGLVDIRSLKGL